MAKQARAASPERRQDLVVNFERACTTYVNGVAAAVLAGDGVEDIVRDHARKPSKPLSGGEGGKLEAAYAAGKKAVSVEPVFDAFDETGRAGLSARERGVFFPDAARKFGRDDFRHHLLAGSTPNPKEIMAGVIRYLAEKEGLEG